MSNWYTEDEIQYIQKLGTHSQSKRTRLDLLNGYLKSLDSRTDWGDMDADVVRDYANMEVMRLFAEQRIGSILKEMAFVSPA